MLYYPMRPLIAVPEPGPIMVITPPIGIDSERHNGNGEGRRVRVEGNVSTFIFIGDVRRIHPPAVAVELDVAPTPIIEATHHLNGKIGIELGHLGVRVIRTGANAGGFGSYGVFR